MGQSKIKDIDIGAARKLLDDEHYGLKKLRSYNTTPYSDETKNKINKGQSSY